MYSLFLLKHCQLHPLQLLLRHEEKKFGNFRCACFVNCIRPTFHLFTCLGQPPIQLLYLCTQHLQTSQDGIIAHSFYTTSFISIPSFVTYLVFSLLIIHFALLTFTLSFFKERTLFQASSFFLAQSNSSGQPDLISLDNVSSTYITKGLTLKPDVILLTLKNHY